MVQFKKRRRSFRTYTETKKQEQEDNRHVSFGEIDRSKYPKLRFWYVLIVVFLGFLYFIAKYLF